MDINSIFIQAFAPAISAMWWLVPLSLLLAFLKSPFVKGMFGEFQVNLLANLMLDKQHYTLFKNITLPTDDGTTQIDHTRGRNSIDDNESSMLRKPRILQSSLSILPYVWGSYQIIFQRFNVKHKSYDLMQFGQTWTIQ